MIQGRAESDTAYGDGGSEVMTEIINRYKNAVAENKKEWRVVA